MKRLMLSVLPAVVLVTMIACTGQPNPIDPTPVPPPTLPGEPAEFYTVGGAVHSFTEHTAIAGARIAAYDSDGTETSTTSSVTGAFSLTLSPGRFSVIVTKTGYHSWGTDLDLTSSRYDLSPEMTVNTTP